MRSISGCAWIATASKPPCSPIITNDGLSAASDCMSVSGRMCSSRSSSGRPLTSRTGTIEGLNRPSDHALAARRLRLDGVGVDVVAREAVFGGDEIGRDALRHEIGGDGDRRVDRPGAARGADADAAHRFDAAADRQLVLARHHLRRGEIDRVEAGGAEAVDLHAGHAVAEARRQRAHARDVAARFADRIDAAHHHVVDLARLEIVAVLDRLERGLGQLQRRRGVQRAVRLAAPARRAHVVVDERVGHGGLPAALRAARCRRVGMLRLPSRRSRRHRRCRRARASQARRFDAELRVGATRGLVEPADRHADVSRAVLDRSAACRSAQKPRSAMAELRSRWRRASDDSSADAGERHERRAAAFWHMRQWQSWRRRRASSR